MGDSVPPEGSETSGARAPVAHVAGSHGWSGVLAGRTILVTGATGPRVGAGICDAVHAAGGQLVINGLDRNDVAATIERYPGSVGVVGDVAQPDDAERIVAEAVHRCGRLDGLVNNAGVGLREPIVNAREEQFDFVFDTDIRGVWLTTRAFARHAIDAGRGGAIVNVSSVHARGTIARFAIYAGAKAAVEGFTRGTALDLGRHDIRCNAIAPGYVPAVDRYLRPGTQARTPHWVDAHTQAEQAMNRVIQPVDCGWAAVFLLSEQSRSITGQVLAVDAGLTVRLYNEHMSSQILGDGESDHDVYDEGGGPFRTV